MCSSAVIIQKVYEYLGFFSTIEKHLKSNSIMKHYLNKLNIVVV